MPTLVKHRLWCKECNDFTLHITPFSKPKTYTCLTCDSDFTETNYSEIPEDKIIEQRNRYRLSEEERISKMVNMAHLFGQIGSLLGATGCEQTIIEDDAGQFEIDKANRIRYEEEYQQRRAERLRLKQEAAKFNILGRNDVCLCGSGLKYKKCCISKYEKY